MALLGRQTFQICKQADRWSWEQEKKWWDCGDTQQLTGTQVSWSCWTVHLLKCVCRWSCILMLVKPCYLFLGLFLQWESHTREFRKCRFYSFIFLSLGCLEVCSTAYIFCLSFLFISFEHMNVKRAKTAAVCCLKSLCRISERKL